MNKYGVGILAAVMIAALVMPSVAAGQATVDKARFGPTEMYISGFVEDLWNPGPIEGATVVMIFFGDSMGMGPMGVQYSVGIEIATARTNASGHYEFMIYAYEYSPALIFAVHPYYDPSDQMIVLLADGYHYNIKLVPNGMAPF